MLSPAKKRLFVSLSLLLAAVLLVALVAGLAAGLDLFAPKHPAMAGGSQTVGNDIVGRISLPKTFVPTTAPAADGTAAGGESSTLLEWTYTGEDGREATVSLMRAFSTTEMNQAGWVTQLMLGLEDMGYTDILRSDGKIGSIDCVEITGTQEGFQTVYWVFSSGGSIHIAAAEAPTDYYTELYNKVKSSYKLK